MSSAIAPYADACASASLPGRAGAETPGRHGAPTPGTAFGASLHRELQCRIENLERSLTDRRYRRQLRREIRCSQRLSAWAGSWRAARMEVTTWQWSNRTDR